MSLLVKQGGRKAVALLGGGGTLAEAMRLRAMLPLASTRKMTSAPAFLASRLLHRSTHAFVRGRPRSHRQQPPGCRKLNIRWAVSTLLTLYVSGS